LLALKLLLLVEILLPIPVLRPKDQNDAYAFNVNILQID